MLTPFNKILIANRGEVAIRVIRSARKLGYQTVAVYSDADQTSDHVAKADQAVRIGGPEPAASYLNIRALIDAAVVSGADAVHPGYGFLAENDAFAKACCDAGLVFIGPSPEAIYSMGDKVVAKELMIAAAVPCIPGYQGDDQSDERLLAEARRIGFPVMIKASAGGGGRGMRLADSEESFLLLLRSARSEARNAFGTDAVFLERAVVDARHVEIQIVADRYGNVIHLGERDCSVQRRHQKLIEEAPSPVLRPEVREQMGATAVAAARAIGYEGVGTFEFLVDPQQNFYFIEANTRLQVEHPVTEEITGLDLVELQLRIAAGEPLDIEQSDIRFSGHSIEVRLCAEDPGNGFMPQSGVMELWEMPEGLRVEHALRSGSRVPEYYDSMIAKLISHGRTRDEARRKLAHGLRRAVALGVATNQAFLIQSLEHPVFADGGATTGFIGEHQDELLRADAALTERMLSLAAVLILVAGAGEQGSHRESDRLKNREAVSVLLEVDGERNALKVGQRPGGLYLISIGERRHEFQLLELAGKRLRFRYDGVDEHAAFAGTGAALRIACRGRVCRVRDLSRFPATAAAGGPTAGSLRASINGRVVAVLASQGERVVAGQPLVVVEAMKMEHVHVAPCEGGVRALHAAVGQQVQAGTLLAELDTAEGNEKDTG